MEALDKARIRLKHWISHSDHHDSEYALFAEELEKAGLDTAAAQIRRMIELNAGCNDCLRKALAALPEE